MNSRILHTIASAIDNKEDSKKRVENGNKILQELLSSVQNCQNRFGGKSELATEDDIRIAQLCEKWEKVLSHGIRTNLSNSTIQSLVNAGLNFTFNIDNVGNSLWSYTCLHLTKHEKERFKILNNINSPFGYFRAFLRASLNERSLERYLHSWISHGLVMEYYDEGSLVREVEASHLLPNMAAGMTAILFALSIDRGELNDTQQPTSLTKSEHLIPLPVPVKTTTNLKRKPLRQIITFDKNEEIKASEKDRRRKSYQPTTGTSDSSCKSAPPTCLNSPDPNSALENATSSISEPTSTDFKSIKQFFPDSVKSIDSPSQILSRLSERAKEIFSSSHSIDVHNPVKDDVSDISINNLKISESDSEEVAGSIDGSTSCLELCFTEDESGQDDNSIQSVLAKKDQEYMALQLKCSQIEIASKDKIKKLEKLVLDLSKENDRLKEQLKKYMSAVGIHTALASGESDNEEVHQYERKLVQVAEMHAELMEFNQHLQRRLLEIENSSDVEIECSNSNIKVHIPAAFLVGKKSHSYHVYQIFIKIGQEEWNVYHRYAKFHELHMQLKKCHSDIANFKFPPKKTLGKKDARVVERRRIELQSYLRHVVLVLPELRNCISRISLVTLLPFFGASSSNCENGMSRHTLLSRQAGLQESVPTYAAL